MIGSFSLIKLKDTILILFQVVICDLIVQFKQLSQF